MITSRQIRAARALLGWDAADLAEKAGLTRATLSNIENSLVQARAGTLEKIARVLQNNGVEFIQNQGIRLKTHSVETYEGKEGFTRFYEILDNELIQNGGDVCVSGVDENLFSEYRNNPEEHRSRMVELLKNHPNFQMRILVAEGDYNFVASKYATYRWLSKESFSPTAFYVFCDYLALISFTHEPAPLVVLIKSAAFSEAYKHSFNLIWSSAKEPIRKA